MNSPRIVLLVGLFGASAAGLTALGHRMAATHAHASPAAAPPLLERHVASVHLHGVAAKEAIPQIEKLIGAKIVARWDAMEKRHVATEQRIWLDFNDVPVGQLMQALTEQLRSYQGSAGFDVQNNAIVIAPDQDLKRSLRIYDVADLRKDASLVEQPHDDVSLAMRFCLEERYWSCGVVVRAQGDWLHEDSTRLFVMQTATAHQQIGAFLAALRHARPDGSGPCIPRSRVLGRHSSSTIVRFYDVRELTHGAEYTALIGDSDGTKPQATWRNTGIQALACVVSHRGRGKSWNSPGQVCGVAGRLIVEQTPEIHIEVRQILDDVRAGKPIEGFRLTTPSSNAHLQ